MKTLSCRNIAVCRLSKIYVLLIYTVHKVSSHRLLYLLLLFPGLTLGSIQLGFLHCGNTERNMVTHGNAICFHTRFLLMKRAKEQGCK